MAKGLLLSGINKVTPTASLRPMIECSSTSLSSRNDVL